MSVTGPASPAITAPALTGAVPLPSAPRPGGSDPRPGGAAPELRAVGGDGPAQPGALALSLWAAQLEAAFLAAEAGSVLTLRMMSFSGLRPMVPGEHLRMVAEKPPAFLAAALAAWIATVSGQRADQVLAAAIRPLRAEASANVLRLSR